MDLGQDVAVASHEWTIRAHVKWTYAILREQGIEEGTDGWRPMAQLLPGVDVEATAIPLAKPSGLSLAAVREYAEKVGRHYGIYDDEGCANLDRLVRRLGGTVVIQGDPESLHVKKRKDFVINIPVSTSARRDRFTVAHELGHYFLHYVLPKETGEARFGRGKSNRAETEANTFASSLLMPTAEFRDAWRELNGDVYDLAERFDVSPRAAEVRCSVLKLRSVD